MRRSKLRFKPIIYPYNGMPDVTLPFGYQHQKAAFFDIVKEQNAYMAPLLILRVNEKQ